MSPPKFFPGLGPSRRNASKIRQLLGGMEQRLVIVAARAGHVGEHRQNGWWDMHGPHDHQ